MNNEQLEEIMKNAQRVQEQLEKSGALKAIEVMNNNPSIKWAIKEVQNLERSGILVDEFQLLDFSLQEI